MRPLLFALQALELQQQLTPALSVLIAAIGIVLILVAMNRN